MLFLSFSPQRGRTLPLLFRPQSCPSSGASIPSSRTTIPEATTVSPSTTLTAAGGEVQFLGGAYEAISADAAALLFEASPATSRAPSEKKTSARANKALLFWLLWR